VGGLYAAAQTAAQASARNGAGQACARVSRTASIHTRQGHGKAAEPDQEAHSALLHFLRQSVAREARTVLVITGKSGVLRREVPQWLALPDFRALLIGFEQAAIRHGGEGALYLRLRKSR
jgi:hypothetical protein